MQVVVDSLLTSYHRTGKGKQVLILHGWGDSSTSWMGFAEHLSRHCEVIRLDLPGFGSSQAPGDVWGLDDFIDFVAAFLRKIGVQPYAIIGHSNGGAIAIRGLADGKLQAVKLVLLASAGIRGEHGRRLSAIKLATKTGKLLTAPLPKSVKKKLRHKVYSSIGSDMLFAEHMQDTFKKVVAQDVRADAAQLHVPALLIYGTADDQTPVRYGHLLQQAIAGSRLETIAGADHFAYLDREAAVLALIESFLP